MSEKHVVELCRVFAALFSDIESRYPALSSQLTMDYKRLERLVSERGLPYLTVDLPNTGKHFDRCLSDSKYTPSHLPGNRSVSRKVQIPQFLRGLHLLVFDETGALRRDFDIDAVFFIRQIYYLAKKTEVDCSDGAKDREILNFIELDASLPEPDGFWETLEFGDLVVKSFTDLATSETSSDVKQVLRVMGIIARDISSTLGSYDPSHWSFRHGPGVCSNTTRFSNKFVWKSWSDKLERVFPFADYGFHSYASWATWYGRDDGRLPLSRLYCVPKSFTRPRIICAEPAEHMWCQQNLWHYFRERSAKTWINSYARFAQQEQNRAFCKRASEDASLVTLDLSSASDTVTCGAVSALFSSNQPLLLALAASRTSVVDLGKPRTLDSWPAEQAYRLRKYAAMGNATTFPVETLLFLTCCLAAVCVKRKLPLQEAPWRALDGQVTVFGDDLIVPEDSWSLVEQTLKTLRFSVNQSKSFTKGFFRESCGHDYFHGHLVTPVYWKGLQRGTPESVSMSVSMHNNFKSKFLNATARHIESTLPQSIRAQKVAADSDLFGLATFDSRSIDPLRVRWNGDLQRWEAEWQTITSRSDYLGPEQDTALLKFFTEYDGPGLSPWDHRVAQAPTLSRRRKWVPLSDLNNH